MIMAAALAGGRENNMPVHDGMIDLLPLNLPVSLSKVSQHRR